MDEHKYIEDILLEGANKADEIAEKKMKEIKNIIGF